MKKYDIQFKLQVVQSYLAGDSGAKLLAQRWSAPEEKVRTWVLHFQWHGIAGLQPKYNRYSERFKREVLAHQDREQLTCPHQPYQGNKEKSMRSRRDAICKSECTDAQIIRQD